MIKSMTAFASCEAIFGMYTINCELRSVNHRYSDISLKLPEQLRFAETEFRSILSKGLKRGKIDCQISYKKHHSDSKQLVIDEQALQALFAATELIEQHVLHTTAYSALDVLSFPGIQQEPKIDQQTLKKGAEQLITEALQQLIAVRSREGEQLSLLIIERCNKIQQLVNIAQQRIPEVLLNLRNKLNKRISELLAEPDFDRLEQELVILAQKLDIDEELDRLDTHVNEVRHTLKQNQPSGRRLDFLMQEMNREANTIGSKSADKDITKISIELKVLIEQMREQIQNIE